MFSDMRDLVDVTASSLRQEIKDIDERTQVALEALEDEHNARVDRIRQEQFNMFQARV